MWLGHRTREKTATPLGLRAPELLQDNSWGPGIDIWSAGCVVSSPGGEDPEHIELTTFITSSTRSRLMSHFSLL